MKKAILMMAMILGSVSAFADVQWQVQNDEKGQRVAKIRGFTIQQQQLHIHTVDTMYMISNEVIQSTGLSMKELLDLLKEYDASKDKVLFFNASKSSKRTFTVDSIGALVAVYTK